jgi:hypothetical protein
VRQWVLSVPKRLRFFMQRDGVVLRIFLRVIAQTLQVNSPGAAHANKAALHIGAETEPPRIAPARGPLLWDDAHAAVGEGVQGMEPLPDWGEGCQAAPDFEAGQRIRW